MKKIKIFAFIGMLTIAYLIGGIMGFTLCSTTTTANANPIPIVTNTQNIQGIAYDYVYVNGTRYLVFMSQTGDIEVVR
jgi:hypothetical protein